MIEQRDRGSRQVVSPVSAAEVAATRTDLRRASLLPPAVYHDPEILAYELEAWFADGWVCVGRTEDIRLEGEYFLTSLCNENIIVVRDNDQQIRAFFNVCRHRGATIVKDPNGRVPRFQCPYHAWVYDLDGALHMPRFCDQLEHFDLNEWGLIPVNVDVWQGFIFLNINNNAAPLLESLGDMPQFFDRFDLAALRRGQLIEYDVQANWKAIIENYSECYHCPGVHPQLNKITPFNMGEWIDTEGPWRASWMPVVGEYDTLTMDGQMTEHGRELLDGMTEDDHKKVYYFVVWPNLLISLHPDYLMTHRVVPIAPGRTYVACEFFFDPEQMARPDFDPSDATEFWDLTNRQDWNVCELQQAGTASRAYTAGRFTAMEGGVYAFDVKVADRYANDGVVTHIEEISKADASAKLAGRIKRRAIAG